jgi:hypothetical protein
MVSSPSVKEVVPDGLIERFLELIQKNPMIRITRMTPTDNKIFLLIIGF